MVYEKKYMPIPVVRYLNFIKDMKVLDSKENERLFSLYFNATGYEKLEIRNKIIEGNLKLVVSFILNKYNYKIEKNPVYNLDDVIQEANLLLIKAIDEYDPAKSKFSTFLFKVLKNDIYYANGIPNCPVEFCRTYIINYKKLSLYFKLEYTDEEISKLSGIKLETLKKLKPLFMKKDRYEDIKDYYEYLEGEATVNLALQKITEEPIINKRNETILEALSGLKEKDRILIVKLFGLDGEEPMKICDINDKYLHYVPKYAYERYQIILKRLYNDKRLKKVHYSVDPDYEVDTLNKSKTYYLQK